MKVRKNKHKILERMANPPWLGSNTMWFMRHIKPCKTYEKGCPDCDAVMFRKVHGRFPYSQAEWHTYWTKDIKWSELRDAVERTKEALCSHGIIES